MTDDFWNGLMDKYLKKTDFSFHGNSIVKLPKMDLSMTADLVPLFRTMGVKNMFEEPGISMESSLGLKKQECLLSKQSVKFDVDEEGLDISVPDQAVDSPTPLDFNRPFIYFVIERSTGTILLAGIYSHP